MDLAQIITFLRNVGFAVVPINQDTWFVRSSAATDRDQQILHGQELLVFGQRLYDSYQQIQHRIAQAQVGQTTLPALDSRSILDTLTHLRYATTHHLSMLYERPPEQLQPLLQALVTDRRIKRAASGDGWQVAHDRAGDILPDDWLVEVMVRLVRASRLFGLSRIRVAYESQIEPVPHHTGMDRWHTATVHCLAGAADRMVWMPPPEASSTPGQIALTFAAEVLDQALCVAATLAARARHYQQAGDASSIPVLVLPDPQSLALARTTWMQHWPTGVWLMTSSAGLRDDMWEGQCVGKLTTGPLIAALARTN